MELFKQDLGKKFKLHKLRTRLEENLEKRDLKIQTDEIAKIERLIRDQVDYDGDRDLDSKMIDDQITKFLYKKINNSSVYYRVTNALHDNNYEKWRESPLDLL